MAILRLPGGSALSGFRLEKLNAALAASAPAWRVTAARHWHFAELEHAPGDAERATLERLLRYGPEEPPGALLVHLGGPGLLIGGGVSLRHISQPTRH